LLTRGPARELIGRAASDDEIHAAFAEADQAPAAPRTGSSS
jgi:hypothetical protein